MKKVLKGAITALLLAGLIFTGCDTDVPENPSDNGGQTNTEQTTGSNTSSSDSDSGSSSSTNNDKDTGSSSGNSSSTSNSSSSGDKDSNSSSTNKDDKNTSSTTDKDTSSSTDKNSSSTTDKNNTTTTDKDSSSSSSNTDNNSGNSTGTDNTTSDNTTDTSTDNSGTNDSGSQSNQNNQEQNTDNSNNTATDNTSGTNSNNQNTNNNNSSDNTGNNDSSSNTDNSSNSNTSNNNSNDPYANLTSVQMAAAMKIGWNLGNTFDAPTETGWGMPTTTKAMIDAVAAAGFKTIRIPVSWSKHVSGTNYTIDSTWMNRVKEVVDWALADGMVVILNVHHDNYYAGASFIKDGETVLGLGDSSISGFAITTNETLQAKSKAYLESVWTQIATTFSSYDNQLVFEVLNEPRCYGETQEWWFGSSTAAKPYCDVITEYEQVCINTIRSIEGNGKRFLMVPGYAASGSSQTMLDAYTMPTDTATDKLLLSAHAYDPSDFAMTGTDYTYEDSDEGAALTSIFNYLKTHYTNNGIGVVMGEASCSNKDNLSERLKWFDAYFSKAKNAGIPVVLWDNMAASPDGTLTGNERTGTNGEHHGYFNRTKLKWYFPTLISTAMDVVGVTGYSIPEYVAPTLQSIGWNEASASTIYTGPVATAWTGKKIDASKFSGANEGSIIKFNVEATSDGCIRMINDSWSVIYNEGTVLNGTSSGDNINVGAGTTEVYYVLTASDASAWKSGGLTFVGPGITINSIKFQN